MKLSSYLDPKFIFTDIVGENKEEIITQMIGRMAHHDKKVGDMEKQIKKAVLAREEEISIAIGGGIAIPHARVEGFDDLVLGMAVLKKPVKSQVAALKGEEDVDLFIIIVSEILKNKKMLKMMAGFMKLATRNPKNIERIRSASNSTEIYNLIKDAEIEIDGKITAEDVLSPNLIPVHPTDTLEEVAKRLIIEERTGLPVLDKDGKFLGEITEKELIEFGMPKYISVMQDVSFLTVGEPFEEYLKNERTTTIEDLYRTKDVLTIDRKGSIMEVCFLLVNKGKTRIYVVENGKYYGMIQRCDIIKKVLHI